MVDIATLVDRCRRGDGLAWEALVRRFQSRVFAVAWHYMRNAEEARDMAQEVFVRVYRKMGSFQGGDAFLPWLLRLARNACIDRLRRERSRTPASEIPIENANEVASGGPSPEDASAAEQDKRLLHRALNRMSDKNREIILLKEIQGLKMKEISRMLSVPIGTVKTRSHRARIELATRVRELDPSYGT